MQKKSHPSVLKFKVALAALLGQPTAEICKQYEVAESSVHKWKKQLKEHGAEIFQGPKKAELQNNDNVDKLHQVIGKLTTEMEFLKKALGA